MNRLQRLLTEILDRTERSLLGLRTDERGQGTAEYIIMTATVSFIIGALLWSVYQGALQDALATLAQIIADAIP